MNPHLQIARVILGHHRHNKDIENLGLNEEAVDVPKRGATIIMGVDLGFVRNVEQVDRRQTPSPHKGI